MAKISNSILNNNSGHSCLISVFRRNGLILGIMLAICLLNINLIVLRYVLSIPSYFQKGFLFCDFCLGMRELC